MHEIRVITLLRASPERCFDLARSVEAHVASAAATGERIVGGRASGLLELGDSITFEARHLGIRQRLTAEITAFDRPHFFQDRMTYGAFRSLEHDHHFVSIDAQTTRMLDVVRFAAPLGWAVERLIVGPHLTRFLRRRGKFLRSLLARENSRPADR